MAATFAMNVEAATPQDLGPLAWVMEDLRTALNIAGNAIRRFIWDKKTGARDHLGPVDADELRQACQKFHQSAGALEMVGQERVAEVLRALETLAQKFVQRPAACTEDAAWCIERASRAVVDYVERLLRGRQASPVALFPQQRAVMELYGADRIHPADLWRHEWQWRKVTLPVALQPLHYAPALRVRLGNTLLPILKTLDATHALKMARLCTGLAAGEAALQAHGFWALAAGFFEAIALACLPDDVYVRRSAAKVMAQYALLSMGPSASLDTEIHDLMFFCALAQPPDGGDCPTLRAVRSAFALEGYAGLDYASAAFGRFDPAQLAAVRKRIAAASEAWSALAGGDLSRFGDVVEQFALAGESVTKLHPDSLILLTALSAAADAAARSDHVPSPVLAVEVATALLFLEAIYEDMDFANPDMERRVARLAQRLQRVGMGDASEPIEVWMEDLYRRVSGEKTMGSVVAEIRLTLSEIEKSLDRYARDPANALVLQAVPMALGQIRGVFSVLGLDQGALALQRMRSSVETLLLSADDPQQYGPPLSPSIVNSLSTLGFMVDMLAYQPAMAKELFVFDEELGEFKPYMDREVSVAQRSHKPMAPSPEAVAQVVSAALSPGVLGDSIESGPNAIALPAMLAQAPAATTAVVAAGGAGEIRSIFLAEARDVIQGAWQVADSLVLVPGNFSNQATLRRAFHTLKGSARMLSLNDFGEAAWAFEQLLNAGLAEQRPASGALVALCKEALDALEQWVGALALEQTPRLGASDFRRCADSLRLHQHYEPLLSADTEQSADALLLLESHPVPEESKDPQALPPERSDNDPAVAIAPPISSIYHTGVDRHSAPQAMEQREIMVGHLRLSADFFEVFVEEPQRWSQGLQSELVQWDVQALQAVPSGAAALAHSLHGSAAAVGFAGLRTLARALEQALTYLELHGIGSEAHKSVVCDAAHEATRLLAGFSVGTLVEPNVVVLQRLGDLVHGQGFALQHSDPQEEPVSEAVDQAAGTEQAEQEPTPDPLQAFPLDLPAIEAMAVPPLARPRHMATPWDTEFETEDALDAELLPVFLEEGAELLSALGTSLRHWAEQPEQLQHRAQALRLLHTLKGSARLAGGLRLGELAHRMESMLGALDLEFSSAPTILASCFRAFEQLQARFDALAVAPPLGAPDANAPTVGPAQAASLSAPSTEVPRVFAAPALAASAPRAAGQQLVRVRVQTLDRLIDQAGEVMISRTRADGHVVQMRNTLGELGRNLDRLRQQLRDIELQAELQMQSGLPQAGDARASFDPLELDRFTQMQEVTRMMAESVGDVESLQRSLQSSLDGASEDLFNQGRRAKQLTQDLLRMRLLEFEALSDRLYAVVRQACKGAEKQVRLDIVGGAIEIDRGVLERLVHAFEHLLRNAVVHGIEPAAARLAAGKPAVGALSISVQQDGSDVSVTFADDGAGLQIEKIRARAVASQLINSEQTLSLEEATRLLFAPGFSTADAVTELAGRGIGMDVVLSEVNAIGGRIETSSQPGMGTRFKVVFPLTTAVTQVLMLRMGALTIGVPANLIETVLRVPSALLDQAYATQSLVDGNRPPAPFFWGGALLKDSARSYSTKASTRQHAVVVIRSAGQRVAMHVDEVLGSREVVVKNLGPQLSHLPGLAGMSVLASGAVVLIYNPVALASLYGEDARRVQAAPSAAPAGHVADLKATGAAAAPLVLVVDDSITVRRVTQRLLQREGYRVALAADGLQALELLQDERPLAVLTDIEMPRMDGMELTRQIRRDPTLAELPIIVITSRIAQKHRDYAAALGVDHYLGKPYTDADLLRLVRTFAAVAVAA